MNKCGSCKVCCITLAIPELDKPIHEPCSHLCSTGCSVYESRPYTCRGFKCLYLLGDWDESLRPDNCGVMIAKFGVGYRALRIRDDVEPAILDMIEKIQTGAEVVIEGVDARCPS